MPAAKSGPVAAEGEERVLARVAPALARDGADRAHHVRGGDQVGAVGGVGPGGRPRGRATLLLEDLAGARRVELHRAPGERSGLR